MMLKVVVASVILVIATVGNVSGHTYHTGSCPSVSPVIDFQMNNVSERCGIMYTVKLVKLD